MLPFLVFLVGAASAYDVTCHCLQGLTCHKNGFCANGCERGWYGPGCQVGNVALGKAAQQSTDYVEGDFAFSGNFAVDGNVPSNYNGDNFAHTAPVAASNGSSWWLVTLNATHYFVITNITLVNRPGVNSYRLSNFVILYSNETEGDPDPSNSSWYYYAEESGSVGLSATYTSNNTIIAKRVAVYLKAFPTNPRAILTLCEVYIYGYEYYDCPRGFTGPGCLLRACGHCGSTYSSCTGDFKSCHYDVCPDQSLLPPNCWITLSNISTLNVSSSTACNSVLVSVALPDSQPNIAASSLQLHVMSSAEKTLLEIATLQLQGTNSATYNFSGATADTSYDVSLKFEYCNVLDRSCFLSNDSKVLTVKTGVRQYFFSHNTSCVFVSANSATPQCEPLSSIQITCESEGVGRVTVNSSTSSVCGLERGQAYNCSFAATVNAKTIERQFQYVIMELFPTSLAPKDEISILAGSIGGSVIIIVVIVAIIVVVYCRQQQNARSQASTVKLVVDRNELVPVGTADVKKPPATLSTRPLIDDEEQAYGNLSGMNFLQFQMYVQDGALIARRFTELQANEARPCINGTNPENKGKNRFQNILPYDLNRVRLDSAANDYINASYINGFSKTKEYIAAQGPTLKTLEDFWHMLWQEKCSVIIMLTDYVEHAKKKCEKYFPLSKHNSIDFEVTIRSQTVCDTHTVTVLTVRHVSEERLIHHFHFLAWPDQSVPSHNAEILLFYSRIGLHLKRHPSTAPVVVHCSAGVGRTGAYIAYDYLQQHYQTVGTVDVDSTVLKLRDQRMFMVQTKEQYIFLHLAVLYGLKTMRYVYDTAQLPLLTRIGTSPSNSINRDMATEWQDLQTVIPKFNEQSFAAAVLPENKHKNRRSHILALELKRPIISQPHGGDQLYINAVYCNGCYSNRAFIATQVPLRQTVADFWLMVYDCQPSCIILLHDLPTSDDETEDCARYWPDPGHSITAGCLEVKCNVIAKDESAMNVMMPGLDISLSPVSRRMADSQIVITKLFTTSLWDINGSAELPTRPNDLVLVANALRTYFDGAPQQPIIVQCRDGVTHSGLFLSAVNALHRLIETDQVSVFHTVDVLRASRPEFVTSEAQYRFIYQVLEEYCNTLNIYANT